MSEKKPIKIGTLTVKNVETNEIYTRELLKSFDILALQEHWLFSFQLSNFDKIFTSHHSYSKAVDADDPLPPAKNLEAMEVYVYFIERVWTSKSRSELTATTGSP